MRRLSIDEMKRIELEVMDEIDRVCREQGIPYFMAFGTLLGAVRHGGFIPWDDDIDIVMLREDYERFVAGYPSWSSGSRFKLLNCRDGESIFQFSKLTDATTVAYENFIEKSRFNGVWVDIFPLDFVNRSDRAAFNRVMRKRARLELVRNCIVTDSKVGTNGFVKLAKRIVCPLAKHLDASACALRIDTLAQTWRDTPTDEVACIAATMDCEMVYPLGIFDPIDLPFEDRVYSAPAGYEQFLTLRYGDWRQLPPESERIIHTFEAYAL